jgi:hypothetical protein
MFLNFFFAHENMKKPASKVAEPAQIQPKSQFLFHKNLPPRDFSLMTLSVGTSEEYRGTTPECYLLFANKLRDDF